MSPIISEKEEARLNKFFFHYRVYPFIALIILFFIVINIFTQLSRYSVYAATEYTLPYPGILPNNQLYPVKAVRDRMVEFFTRDASKRAELYLLYADKRISMAKMLSEEDKWELAEITASKAEKYYLKLQDSVIETKSMGSAVDIGFFPRVKLSQRKHEQILKTLLKKSPKEQKNGFKETLDINSRFGNWANGQK